MGALVLYLTPLRPGLRELESCSFIAAGWPVCSGDQLALFPKLYNHAQLLKGYLGLEHRSSGSGTQVLCFAQQSGLLSEQSPAYSFSLLLLLLLLALFCFKQ